ncbi:Sulfotransferase domain [Dillenia turbinata]|uniref:Sulfotransferase n=1 Tax=Dillenia turbinata TaxID=194707 RepID=A0AAN8Z697_9MAGN
MAEDLCLFHKDATIIIKPPKKSSSVFLRMIVLGFAMACGIYICSICLKQANAHIIPPLVGMQLVQKPCQKLNVQESEIPNLHYPRPETFSRAECACNPVRYFAILSMQRSGSGWFETLLNSHINVSSNGEIFSVKGRRTNASTIMSTLDRVYNLDWFTSASKNQCSAAIGFKWMLNQGLMEHHEAIAKYFNERGVSAIFLFRRNLLRRMISVLANSYDRFAPQLNGTHKSHVHSIEEANALARYKPTINSSSLLTDLKDVELTVMKALEYFNSTRHMVLYYEDIVKDHSQKLLEVKDFLKLPHMRLTSRQVKIHQGPFAELVANWEDVNKTLMGTVYESFLHSDY